MTQSGTLTYCNAGHNPPYLLNTQNRNTVQVLGIAQANLERSAQDIQNALPAEVHEFMGSAPRLDDIIVMVLVRDSSQKDFKKPVAQ